MKQLLRVLFALVVAAPLLALFLFPLLPIAPVLVALAILVAVAYGAGRPATFPARPDLRAPASSLRQRPRRTTRKLRRPITGPLNKPITVEL